MSDLLGLPIDASVHGQSIDQIIVFVHWLMAFLFVGWGGFFVYSLIRFREKRNPAANYDGVKSHASSYLEVAVVVFEGVLLVGFAVPVWSNVWLKYPDPKDAVVIHVVAEQFAWNIHYPGPDGKFGRRDISLVTSDNPLGRAVFVFDTLATAKAQTVLRYWNWSFTADAANLEHVDFAGDVLELSLPRRNAALLFGRNI